MQLSFKLPDWLIDFETSLPISRKVEDRVAMTLELTRRNLQEGSGGPFGAIIFERKTCKPVAAGVNLVVSSGFSLFHAEVIAILRAQDKLKTYDLSTYNLEMVASCEPCIMCHGALLWSGIHSLVYSADKEDAENIGFDEGDKPHNWRSLFGKRKIMVLGPILREEGKQLLKDYADGNGTIYNPLR